MEDDNCCSAVIESDDETIVCFAPELMLAPRPSETTTTTSFSPDLNEDQFTPQPVSKPPPKKRGRPKKTASNPAQPPPQPELHDWVLEAQEKQHQESIAQAKRDKEYEQEKLKELAGKRKEHQEKSQKAVEWNDNGEDDSQESREKKKALKKIEMLYSFYTHLKDSNTRRGKWSMKCSQRDLDEELLRCDHELEIARALDFVQKLDLGLNFAAEKILVNGFDIPVNGLAFEAKRSQDMMEEELKDLAIKYHDRLKAGPEVRYLVKFALRINMVLEANKAFIASSQPKGQSDRDLDDKYADY